MTGQNVEKLARRLKKITLRQLKVMSAWKRELEQQAKEKEREVN